MSLHSNLVLKKILLTALYLSVLPLLGCTVVSDYLKDSLNDNKQNIGTQSNDVSNSLIVDLPIKDAFAVFHTNKKVNDYTSRLAYELVKNARSKVLSTPVAVASFVDFNNVKESSKFGKLISENLITQLQMQDISVIDIHLMDAIQTTSEGDFVFNNQISDYFQSESIDYVLSGTLTESRHGLTINARIVQFGNRRVISSATTLVPYFVVDMYK